MAEFTFVAIDGAAKTLAQFDGVDAAIWSAMDEADRLYYRLEAKKILESAKQAVQALGE